MGDKYLSEVISAKDIAECEEQKICIYSGVGSGKNWFVENELIHYGNILYITSRRAKVNEILIDRLCQERIIWDKECEDVVTTTNYGIQMLVKNEKFGNNFVRIMEHFDFVVVDEAHSMFTDATFAESAFHVHTFIKYVEDKYPNIKIILMTGTPEPMSIIGKEYKVFDVREECINVLPRMIRIIKRDEAVSYMASLPAGEKTIYYTNSATKMVSGDSSLYKKLLAAGYEDKEIAFCMSERSCKKLGKVLKNLQRRCERTKEVLTKDNKLEDDVRILLTTSTLKEGVNIKEESVKTVFCESHVLSDIQQFAGRVRLGVDVLYIISDAMQHDVTDIDLKRGMLDYIYGQRYQLEAVNKFLNLDIKDSNSGLYKYLEYESGLLDIAFMYEGEISIYNLGGNAFHWFVEMIEARNPYIKFNYLTGQFELFKNRMIEQKRVNSILKDFTWEKELDKFSQANGIDYMSALMMSWIDKERIRELLEVMKDKILVEVEKDAFLGELCMLLAFRDIPKFKTINMELEGYAIRYELRSGTTKRKGKSKRYVKVVSL